MTIALAGAWLGLAAALLAAGAAVVRRASVELAIAAMIVLPLLGLVAGAVLAGLLARWL